MSSLAVKLKEHWLVSILSVGVAGGVMAWTVSEAILVNPRDFRIKVLEKQRDEDEKRLVRAEDEIQRLEEELADSARAAINPLMSTHRDEVAVDFPWVNTASAPGFTVAASPYLHGAGITVKDLDPQDSELVLMNNRALYNGGAVVPTTSQNFLTQISANSAGITSFTLVFAGPCENVTFTRPALYAATESGITHPAWSARAFDALGRGLSAQSEGLIRSYDDVAARTYSLRAPGFEGISAVRFDSDWRRNGKPFAAFRALLIEKLTLTCSGRQS